MTRSSRFVLDSWAIICWLQDEPSAERVDELMNRAVRGRVLLFMSYINVGEAYYVFARNRGLVLAEEFLTRLPSLPIRVSVPDAADIVEAARFKARYPLAYGDAFAICLGRTKEAAVATGDREIRDSKLVRVEWLGR